MTSTAPAPSSSRPALPIFRLNPHLATIPTDNLVVKYQTIVREGNEIIVGRVKVPTPEGHAFVLRRYDTGAFSLTTMFKATFPGASNEEEKIECEWVSTELPSLLSGGWMRLGRKMVPKKERREGGEERELTDRPHTSFLVRFDERSRLRTITLVRTEESSHRM
ncbi:hypothetical protein BDY24DRAFT_177430 [Mrakia frigida]|uniref:uncharacterized protein n=1 Tax=Mrakia frigida TaxID=29902 RepID=UPI003FCBF52B